MGAWGRALDGSDTGQAYLLLGSSLAEGVASLSQADQLLFGESSGDYAGATVAWAGDVNGDGLSDGLIGAEGNDEAATDAGKAYIWLGR